MKKIIAILLLIFSFTYSSTIYASAAEKWEYDVIPDQNQKLKVKGHKVDQYGDAVNDKKYTTTIDPKTTTNRQKMGKVGMNRLLKVTGWGTLGYEALKALLEAVDWVIDPEAQSIWRHKKNDHTGVTCSYTQNYQGKVYSVVYKDSYGDFHSCPLEAALHRIEYHYTTSANSIVEGSGRFLRWDTTDFSIGVQYFYADYLIKPGLPNAGQRVEIRQSVNAARDKEIIPDKEILTEQDLADYANRTHKDYSNPELAPKLNPKYNPSIQTDLWKPSNKFEEENSPTVEEAIKQLEVANPDSKDDTIKENEPNPETGEKSFSLPAFCNWATAVCDFFDWMKQEPEKDPEQNLPDVDDKGIFSKTFDFSFSLSSQCPPDISWKLESQYLSGNFTFSMKWLCIIFTALGYPIVFASHCVGIWILYEAAVRKEIKW
ncbi:hypothetical protein DX910_13570 [Acinetobacter haemolyticus]|nr:hypothetical protein DX910_13570 [Acinetobacter haemolyticus]